MSESAAMEEMERIEQEVFPGALPRSEVVVVVAEAASVAA